MKYYKKPEIINAINNNKHLLIEASAGTGKTYTIEHIILDLIIKGLRIDQILVVTFTKLATKELQIRIHSILQNILTQETDTAPNAPHWELNDTHLNNIKRALDNFDTNAINTIHGFCSNVLAENYALLSFPPSYSLLSINDIYDEAFKKLLRFHIHTHNKRQLLLETYLKLFNINNLHKLLKPYAISTHNYKVPFDPNLLDTLNDNLNKLFNKHTNQTKTSPTDLNDFNQETLKCILNQINDIYQTIEPHLNKTHKNKEKWNKFHHTLKCSTLSSPEKLLRLILEDIASSTSKTPLSFLAPKSKAKTPPELEFKHLLSQAPEAQEFINALSPLLLITSEGIGLSIYLKSMIIHELLPVLKTLMQEIKYRNQTLTFDDLILPLQYALTPQKNNPSHNKRAKQLATILRNKYKVALVDEFQDTDKAQWDIFKNIFLTDTPHNTSQLIVVGDPKQAIYTFRGADLLTYFQAKKEINNTKALTTNYRSSYELVELFNTIFSTDNFFNPNPTSSYTEINYPISNSSAEPSSEKEAALTLISINPTDSNKISDIAKNQLAEQYITEILKLHSENKIEYKDIFILSRSNSDLYYFSKYLNKHTIPYTITQPNFESINESVIDLFIAILNPTNISALKRAWNTPFFDIPLEFLNNTDNIDHLHPIKSIFLRWNTYAINQNYEKLFADIFNFTKINNKQKFWENHPSKHNLYQNYFNELLSFTKTHHLPLSELIVKLKENEIFTEISDDDNSAIPPKTLESNSIKLLSIHAAKGLQADTVFFFGGVTGRSATAPYIFHDLNKTTHNFETYITNEKSDFIDLITTEEEREKKRLIYVALTRAKKRLYLPFLPESCRQTETQSLKSGLLFDLYDTLEHLLKHYPHLCKLIDTPCIANTNAQKPTPQISPPALSKIIAFNPPKTEPLNKLTRTLASYSSIKQLNLPNPEFDDFNNHPKKNFDDTLPAGANTGNLLHELLENTPFDSLFIDKNSHTTHEETNWINLQQQNNNIQKLFLKYNTPEQTQNAALKLIYNAILTPFPKYNLPPLAYTQKQIKETKFFYPIPETIQTYTYPPKRGWINGIIDLTFLLNGKTYILDWKSDTLPNYNPETIENQVTTHYNVQLQIYTLAIIKALNIQTEEQYNKKFGGVLYFFLRAINTPTPQNALYFPSHNYHQLKTYKQILQNTDYN